MAAACAASSVRRARNKIATYEREVSRSLDAGQQPAIEVSNPTGSVRIRGEDRVDVLVVAKARFTAGDDNEAAELMDAIVAGIEADGQRVRVQSPHGRGDAPMPGFVRRALGWSNAVTIDYEIVTPRGTSVAINLVHGHAEALHIDGRASLHLVNGTFRLEGLGGDASVKLVNGDGATVRTAGDLDLTMTNGRLQVEAPAGETRFKLVNGDVRVAGARGRVEGGGVSGRIEFEGAVLGDLKLRTMSGRIVLKLPADSRFELDARSRLGSVTSELNVRDGGEGGPSGRKAPLVQLRSESGDIALQRLREAEPAGAPGTPFERA